MIGQLTRTFHRVADSYRRDLSVFWPTVGSRGFTEQNQIHQFCKEAERVLPSPVATYVEVPFGGRDRLDGLVVNLNEEHPALVLLEAKRIKEGGYNSAYSQIAEDVKRMEDKGRVLEICKRIISADHFGVVYIYMACLADVWVGNTKRSAEVVELWCDAAWPLCVGWEDGTFLASGPVYHGMSARGKDVEYRLLLGIGPEKFIFEPGRPEQLLRWAAIH